ncbi:MAG: DUF116 domain-containing protein [Candidatus Altiarchaeia archaeon]
MDLFSDELLKNIGLVSVITVVSLIALLVIALVLTYLMFRNTKIIKFINNRVSSIVLKILLTIQDLLYMPAKKIIIMAGGNDMMIDAVGTEMRNILFKNAFSQVPYSERIIVIPQCLRSMECPAKFNSVEGARCLECGKCKIKEISKKAKELGYIGTFIAPGSSFITRIVKKTKPKALIGLGCPYEVNLGLLAVSSKGIPCQGVTLLTNGCVTTDVDLNAVFETMELLK